MPYIALRDGQELFIRDIGRKSNQKKPTIILIHGFGMQSTHWLPFVLPLAKTYRFLIPDLRGFGRSHSCHYNQKCVISNFADDLADIIDAYRLNTFKLVGISMGAFIALQYQGIYGDNSVHSYLHIDQSPKSLNSENWHWGIFGSEQSSRLQSATSLASELTPYIEQKTPYVKLPIQLKLRLWQDLGDFFASALSKPSHKFLVKKACSNEKLIRHIMPVSNWPAYIHCLKAYVEQDYDMQPILKKLDTPISLIVGMKSEMYPCGGQLRIADYSAHCEVIPFESSGHTPLIDQPIRFLQELARFASK